MSPNFHPIRPRPTPITQMKLVPQIQPKVPGVETDSGEERIRSNEVITDRTILTNDNNGVWFIEEKIKNLSPNKRDFLEENNRTTINPALTEKPRTWPASILKKNPPEHSNNIYDDVTILEKSRNGEIGVDHAGGRSESTTFSTSRVTMSMSTTPSSVVESVEQVKSVDEDQVRRNMLLMKAHNLLDSLAHNERNLDQQDHVRRIGVKGKRKRLRQQARPKSLPGDDAYVVYPMENVETKKPDQQFTGPHPGLKRISAYDFERAMEKAEDSITKPVAELKVSIEDLAKTMNQLTKNVLETSTKNEDALDSEDKILQLQEEIAKLTKTLETLQLSPKDSVKNDQDDLMLSPTEQMIKVIVTERPYHDSPQRQPDISTHAAVSQWLQGSESVKTWHKPSQHEVIDTNHADPGTQSNNNLDIVEEVFTTSRPESVEKKQMKTNNQHLIKKKIIKPSTTTERVFEILPVKVETSDSDIKNFFGDDDDELDTSLDSLSPNTIISDKFHDQDNDMKKSSHRLSDAISQDPTHESEQAAGVLGLFEMMGKINKEAAKNFDVVKLPTRSGTEISIKEVQQQLLLEEMQEKLQREQIDKIKAEEEELRKQQMEKLKLFNLFQEEEKKMMEQRKQVNDQNKFSGSSVVQSFDSLQGWSDEASWEKTIRANDDKATEIRVNDFDHNPAQDDRGTAFATLTIENVDPTDGGGSYQVNNGIVTLKKNNNVNNDFTIPTNNDLEFDYEYYEADPDDIQFPVGGTRQFYENQSKKSSPGLGNLDQLSNKELLLNLMEASNNFQNQEFLDRLKTIVTGAGVDGSRGGSTSGVENKNHFSSSSDSRGSVTLVHDQREDLTTAHDHVSTDKWAPASQLPGADKLENNVNNLPIWPSNNNNFISSVRSDFKPSNSFRFPNRRIDDDLDTGGVGEISLVSDTERRKLTSVGGFSAGSNDRKPDYKISDRLDFTSDNQFHVGTSLSMSQPQSNSFGFNSGNTGLGLATAVPRVSSPISVTSAPSLSRGSEVFRLGSGVHIQQPGAGASPVSGELRSDNNQNYILPTYTNTGRHSATGRADNAAGEIYADIRLESEKKNLLGAPSDNTQSLYYSRSETGRPEAELIVYPMGQLLSGGVGGGQTLGQDMIQSGSGYHRSATLSLTPDYHDHQSPGSQLRDQRPFTDTHQSSTRRVQEDAPKNLLETIIRTAKDDLNFAGNVLSYITSRTQ